MQHWDCSNRVPILADICEPSSSRAHDTFAKPQKGLGGGGSETYQNFGAGKFNLSSDKWQASLDLLGGRSSIARRTPRDDIGDVYTIPVKSDGAQHSIKQLSRAPDKGSADAFFLASRRLPNQHHPRPRDAVRKHELRGCFLQSAAVKPFKFSAQGGQVRASRGAGASGELRGWMRTRCILASGATRSGALLLLPGHSVRGRRLRPVEPQSGVLRETVARCILDWVRNPGVLPPYQRGRRLRSIKGGPESVQFVLVKLAFFRGKKTHQAGFDVHRWTADLPSAQTGVNRLYRSTPIAKKDVEGRTKFRHPAP